MRKRAIKRFARGEEVEIEERSTKSPRLIAEEKAKAPEDYAGLGGRMKPTPAPSTWAGPREYITESKETEVEESKPSMSEGIAAGKGARNLALEEPETPKARVYPGPKDKTKVQPKATRKETEAPASSKMMSAKDIMEKGRAGPVESSKAPQTSKRMTVEEARQKAKEMTSKKKEPTEEQKESGRKFSEEKLRKQRESFESTPISKFFKKFSESPKETAERKAKEIRGYKSGGKTSSASSRADGIATRGKTRGRIC